MLRTIELDNKKIKLHISDTAGQQRFRSITKAHYRNAMGVLLVYDITSEQSFKSIEGRHKEFEKHSTQQVNKILIGNYYSCSLWQRNARFSELEHEIFICNSYGSWRAVPTAVSSLSRAPAGNKLELESQRQVSAADGRRLAGDPSPLRAPAARGARRVQPGAAPTTRAAAAIPREAHRLTDAPFRGTCDRDRRQPGDCKWLTDSDAPFPRAQRGWAWPSSRRRRWTRPASRAPTSPCAARQRGGSGGPRSRAA